jgi:hypothetical protein
MNVKVFSNFFATLQFRRSARRKPESAIAGGDFLDESLGPVATHSPCATSTATPHSLASPTFARQAKAAGKRSPRPGKAAGLEGKPCATSLVVAWVRVP